MDLGTILAKATPWLAAAAAGPAGLAGMAVKTIAEALGSNTDDQAALAAAVAGATPEQIKALKLADMEFRIRMQELGFKNAADLAKIDADDRDSARKAAVAGGTARHLFWLSVLLLGATLGAELAVLFVGYPKTVPDIVVGRVLGLLDSVALAVMAYWYGTSSSSQQKTEMLARAEPIKA